MRFPMLKALSAGLVVSCGLLSANLQAQIDEKAFLDQVDQILERQAGRRISNDQKAQLGELLKTVEGKDLGAAGYVRAMHLYLGRQASDAAEIVDEFLVEYPTIERDEHRSMVGRILLNAIVVGLRSEPIAIDTVAFRAERMAAMYGDVQLISRVILPLIEDQQKKEALDAKQGRRLRFAIARGLLDRGQKDADAVERLMREMFTAPGQPIAIPAARITPGRAGRQAGQPAPSSRDALNGNAAPKLDALHVLGAEADLSLDKLKGKVVVLDFWATWCGPCRRVIPELVALQKEHEGDLQVLGVTRFYGNGVDFSESEPDLYPPQGGQSVRNLTEEEELQLNRDFRGPWRINYPFVFVPPEVTSARYGVQGIPCAFVIGKDGKVLGHVVGAGAASKERLEGLVAQALKAGD